MLLTRQNTPKVKFVFTLFIILFMTSFLHSQITITQSELMSLFTPGNNIYGIPGDSGLINIGNTHGPNIYDFSFIDMQNVMTFYNYEVSQIPELASRYPNNATTFAVDPQNIDGNPIFVNYNDSTFFAGQAFIQNDYQFTHYAPYEKFTDFPLVYGNPGAWQIVDVYDTTYNANWQITDTYYYNDIVAFGIDGYGTLLLPDTSLECLRMRRDYSWFQYKEFLYLTREGILISVSDVAVSEPDTGFVGGDYIVLLDYIPAPSAIEYNSFVPSKIKLTQNYPNPFNPTTKISYNLPRSGFVTLTIFDYLGREIRTLTKGNQYSGSHTIVFDGGNLASGIYFYQLKSGNIFSETRKMILMR